MTSQHEDTAAVKLTSAVKEWSENHMDQFETFWIESKFGPVFVRITRQVAPSEKMHYNKWE